MSHETIVKVSQAFCSATPRVGDLIMTKRGQSGGDEIPDFEECCEQLHNLKVTETSFRIIHMHALKMKFEKKQTLFDHAIVTYLSGLREWLAHRVEAKKMVFRRDLHRQFQQGRLPT